MRDRDSVFRGCSPTGKGGGGAGRRNKAKGTSFGERGGVPRPAEPEFWQRGRGRRPDEAGAAPLVSFLTKGGAASWTFESDAFKAKTELKKVLTCYAESRCFVFFFLNHFSKMVPRGNPFLNLPAIKTMWLQKFTTLKPFKGHLPASHPLI